MNIVTRFPPSPTGFLHIGRARTALFNYLFTRKNKGKMVFRIEDTDRQRSKREYEQDIIDCLAWLGIAYDSGPFRQSERNAIYSKYIQRMIETGQAYVSKEDPTTDQPEEGGAARRGEVIRFKNPNKKVVFDDMIRGRIEFDTSDLKDFVIARSIEEPLYHLTVVVDDYEMEVTHVIRGEDGISNTPRQILIQEAIGAPRPIYAHIPLILAADKSKLSGRHGAVSVTDYRRKGYLPQALLNYLALLGWNPGTDQEIFSLPELIEVFDLGKVQKGGAVFSEEKLAWFNRQYIAKLSDEEFVAQATPFFPDSLKGQGTLIARAVPVLREKISFFGEISEMFDGAGEMSFLTSLPDYATDLLLWKKNPSREASATHLAKARELISAMNADQFNADQVKAAIWPYADATGRGDVLWPVRVSLTGREKSPDPFACAAMLGKEETLKRIEAAISKLK